MYPIFKLTLLTVLCVEYICQKNRKSEQGFFNMSCTTGKSYAAGRHEGNYGVGGKIYAASMDSVFFLIFLKTVIARKNCCCS